MEKYIEREIEKIGNYELIWEGEEKGGIKEVCLRISEGEEKGY